jgi:hypothetical protein
MTIAHAIRKLKKLPEPFDRLNPAYAKNISAEEKRRRAERWQVLNQFIHESGGWVTSIPGAKVMRIEVKQNLASALAAKLVDLGFKVEFCGTGTRLVGGGLVETITERGKQRTVTHAGPVPVEIIELRL